MNAPTLEIADRIRTLHAEAQALAESAIERALEAGRLLTEVKAELPHGDFGAWVEEHCGFTARTAQRYMRLHENRERLPAGAGVVAALSAFKSDTVSHLDTARALVLHAGQVKTEIAKLVTALDDATTADAAFAIATRTKALQGAVEDIKARATQGLELLKAGSAATVAPAPGWLPEGDAVVCTDGRGREWYIWRTDANFTHAVSVTTFPDGAATLEGTRRGIRHDFLELQLQTLGLVNPAQAEWKHAPIATAQAWHDALTERAAA